MSVICARISGVLRSSCILLGGEINHEADEGHGEFVVAASRCEAPHPVTNIPYYIAQERNAYNFSHARSRCSLTLAAPGPSHAGLIFVRLFASIAACPPLITERRGVRSVKALEAVPLPLPPRIGAWS